MTKEVIGWREWVDLPELNLANIKAKIDTGARSSSLHAYDIHAFDRDGKHWVRFKVHPLQHSDEEVVSCEAPVKDYRRITDSGGHKTMRYMIETRFCIGGDQFTGELSLFNRSDMLFRMLVGRTALKGRYVVDPARSYCRSQAPAEADSPPVQEASPQTNKETGS